MGSQMHCLVVGTTDLKEGVKTCNQYSSYSSQDSYKFPQSELYS